MLSGLAARGQGLAEAGAARARERLARDLGEVLPALDVSIEDEDVVLTGRIDPEDVRRWIAEVVR